jgi:D-glycero-D-manno-heptose 1,7-bisphosphate phosphatase
MTPPDRSRRAILFDRDGTLIVDVPYIRDPERVVPMPSAAEAMRLARAAGAATGVVTNQSGVGRGLLSREQVAQVNRRVDALLGPFDVWAVCPHAPDADCGCRKPRPGLILEACAALDVRPEDVVVIGDIAGDLEAAHAAGARAVLVPTAVTEHTDISSAEHVAVDLAEAVRTALRMQDSRSTEPV